MMMVKYFGSTIVVLVFSAAMNSYGANLPPRPVTFIPSLYVTNLPEGPDPNSAVMYAADICNPNVYAGYMVIVRVNIPNGWNPYIGLVAKLEVCASSACDNVICSNFKNGIFNGQHNCLFAYNTSYDHVYIRVTAGDAPNIAWTVALEFTTKLHKHFQSRQSKHVKKYFYLREPKARNQISQNDVKPLAEFAHLYDPQVVGTMNKRDFSFSLCPSNSTTQSYSVIIVVTATDSRSAFATYVCIPPTTGPKCTPSTATQSDPRGIAINVVNLQTGSVSLKDLYVVVVGWGDGEQENNFIIGARMTKNEKYHMNRFRDK